MTHLSDRQVTGTLRGMAFPARLWEIVAWAEFNGAGPVFLDALYRLPAGSYSGPHAIVEAVEGCCDDEHRGCQHRRHPRMCSAHRDFTDSLAS